MIDHPHAPEGGFFGKNQEKLVITVLDETREVDGIMTRVVEEKEWKNEQIIEVSRNFFAICEETNDVFYFGEEVDMYRNGKVANHKGAWLAGENGAKPGLIMPGEPKKGMKYYQEVAKGVAMDIAEIINIKPATRKIKCLFRKYETSPNSCKA